MEQVTKPMPKRLRSILLAIRPKTLFLGLCPVILGTSLAFAALPAITWRDAGFAFITILVVVLLQAGANLVNDVKDFEQGIDGSQKSQGAERLGPRRAVAEGWLSPATVTALYRGCFAVALILSAALALMVDLRLLGVGIACAAAAYAYTGGPFPLAYYGLGELLAWLFFGPVAVASCYYLYHQDIPSYVWSYSTLTGIIAAAVMAINNYRDRHSDKATGKATFATSLPDAVALRVVQALIIAPVVVFALLEAPRAKLGLTLFFLALMVLMVKRVIPSRAVDGASLNSTLGETSRFGLMVTLLASIKVLL